MTSDISVTMCAIKKFSSTSLFCEIRCVSFVLMLKKKTMPKKINPDEYLVSSSNKSEVPAKKGPERSFILCKWT